MKKIITYLIASTMLLSFTACNSENQNSSDNSFLDPAKKEEQEAKEHSLSESFIKKDDNSKEDSLEDNYTEEELKNALKSEVRVKNQQLGFMMTLTLMIKMKPLQFMVKNLMK